MSRLLHTKLVKESRIAAKQNLNKQLDIHKQKIDDVDRNRELHDLIDEQIASSGGVVDHELKVCVHRACVCACMYVCVCVCVCVCWIQCRGPSVRPTHTIPLLTNNRGVVAASKHTRVYRFTWANAQAYECTGAYTHPPYMRWP